MGSHLDTHVQDEESLLGAAAFLFLELLPSPVPCVPEASCVQEAEAVAGPSLVLLGVGGRRSEVCGPRSQKGQGSDQQATADHHSKARKSAS